MPATRDRTRHVRIAAAQRRRLGSLLDTAETLLYGTGVLLVLAAATLLLIRVLAR